MPEENCEQCGKHSKGVLREQSFVVHFSVVSVVKILAGPFSSCTSLTRGQVIYFFRISDSRYMSSPTMQAVQVHLRVQVMSVVGSFDSKHRHDDCNHIDSNVIVDEGCVRHVRKHMECQHPFNLQLQLALHET